MEFCFSAAADSELGVIMPRPVSPRRVSTAVTAPRFGTNHHVGSFRQKPPELGSLLVYEAIGSPVIEDLRRRGHSVQIAKPPLWNPSVLVFDPQTGKIDAAGDPAAGRHAAAY